ncbi:hypothetical protein LPA44_16355 [Halobacterium sp. KA-4]|nr:hypothetical protein [Halobacterium sp. KA-4]
MEILQALGNATEPVSFSELHDDVSVRDSGQFNYHLNKLVGHFVEQTEDGYRLRQAGRRVIEAILSGAVTKAPKFELTTIDEQCHYCGAQIAVRYSEERVQIYCTNCEGAYASPRPTDEPDVPGDYGSLGAMLLPPAGVEGRTPEAAYRAAWTWGNLEILAMASGICPRCSADTEPTIDICEDHNSTEGICGSCGRRYAVFLTSNCTNCNYKIGGGLFLAFCTITPLLSFLLEHDINPISPDVTDIHKLNRVHEDYTEDILTINPLKVRLTTTIEGDEFALTVDEDLEISDVSY